MQINIKEIVDLLNVRIEELCGVVLPSGHREGHDWVDAHLAQGGLGDSLKVCLSGARQGVWSHFAQANKGGDALELISYVMFADDKARAIEWAKSWLGLDNTNPDRLKQDRLKAAKVSKNNKEKAVTELEDRRKYAHRLWLGGAPSILNTPVDMYLAGRNIDIRKLSKVPGALRYAQSLKHANKELYPAMTAAVYNGKGEFLAVHRTYLKVNHDGSVDKADLGDQAKLVLGGYKGGFITLQRGASGKSLKDAPVGDKVILSEGIEDGLSLAIACPNHRVLACISVNNFANITLPKAIGDVIIAADNDPETVIVNGVEKPHAAHVAVLKAVDVFLAQGRNVFVARSPSGKDFNDALRKGVSL